MPALFFLAALGNAFCAAINIGSGHPYLGGMWLLAAMMWMFITGVSLRN